MPADRLSGGEARDPSCDMPLETGNRKSLQGHQPRAQKQNCGEEPASGSIQALKGKEKAANGLGDAIVELTLYGDVFRLCIKGLDGVNTFSCMAGGWKDRKLEVLLT